MTAHTTEHPPEDEPRWPRLGGLATVPGRDGVWSVWSRGSDLPRDYRKWWLVPVDATERDRADLAVLLRDTEFWQCRPAETEALI